MNKILPKAIIFCGILAILQISFSGMASASTWLLVASGFGVLGFWLKQSSVFSSVEET